MLVGALRVPCIRPWRLKLDRSVDTMKQLNFRAPLAVVRTAKSLGMTDFDQVMCFIS